MGTSVILVALVPAATARSAHAQYSLRVRERGTNALKARACDGGPDGGRRVWMNVLHMKDFTEGTENKWPKGEDLMVRVMSSYFP
ncbi:hypothetical protein GN956_G9898 [Arapaima gigas]